MTEPLGISEEMRQAVLDAECLTKGHDFDWGRLVASIPDRPRIIDVGAGDADVLPHLRCHRCDKVWILIEDPGYGYEDAEDKVQKKLKTTDTFSKAITQKRNNRKAKRETEVSGVTTEGHTH
jgi:hypothetical protein